MMKKICLFGLGLCLVLSARAQQSELTFLHLYRSVPQANMLNPALFPEYKFSVSFPGLGSNFVYLNNNIQPLSYFIDNIDANGTLTFNARDFSNRLQGVNRVEVGASTNLLNLSLRLPATYIAVGANFKTNFGISVPKSIFSLLLVGNQGIANEDIGLDQFSLRSSAYTEYYLTVGREITTDLYIGARAKYLNGLFHIGLDRIGASFDLSPTGIDLTLKEFALQTGGLAGTTLEALANGVQNVQLPNSFSGAASYFNNHGFAMDVGAQYQLDRFMFHAGLSDLGFIRWNPAQSFELQFKEVDFSFDGLDLNNLIQNPQNIGNFDNPFENINVDSLIKAYAPTVVAGEGYTTSLSGRLYMGAYFDIADWHRIGLLSYGTIINRRIFPSLSFAYNVKFKRIVDVAVTTSLVGGKLNNIGLGSNVNLGLFHLFLTTDNILPLFAPGTVQNTNFRLGVNFNFGEVGAKKVQVNGSKQTTGNQGTLDFLGGSGGLD